MIDDRLIRYILRQDHFGVLWGLLIKFQYEIEDVVQECQLYWAKHPDWDERFVGQLVRLAMADLLRKELGQPRMYPTREAYEQKNKLYARKCAVMHSFDNALDPLVRVLPVDPQVSDLPTIMATAMEVLTLREWWVLVEWYWFNQDQEAIGRRFGIGGSRVCQIITATFPKLRRALPPKEDLV